MDSIEWLAGLLDAEGYFGLQKNTCVIAVDMRDEDILERVSNITNKSKLQKKLPKQDHHSTQYRWAVSGLPAISIAQQIYPYVCQRRKNAILKSLKNWEDHRRIQLLIPEKKTITLDYVIGLIEGDGTMFINKSDNCPRLAIGTIDQDMIEGVQNFFNGIGHIYEVKRKNPNHKTLYRWDLYKKQEVQKILTEIYPLLGVRRREQAQKILEL